MGKRIRSILILILFCAVLFFCLVRINYVVRDKQNSGVWDKFEAFDKDSIDVIFVGTSHQFCSVNPEQLYEDYGINSFMLATSAQTVPMSYYAVCEAIEEQHPDTIVFEVSYMANDFRTVTDEMSHCFFDGMPLGKNRTAAIKDLIEPENQIYFNIPLGLYHSRWQELAQEDYIPTNLDERGGVHYEASVTNTEIPLVDPSETEALYPEMEKYLRMIIDVCKENGVTLKMYAAPFNTLYDNDDASDLEGLKRRERVFNTIASIAEDEGLEYVNMFYLIDEIGISSTDWMDRQHLNYFGAEKVSGWMVKSGFLE